MKTKTTGDLGEVIRARTVSGGLHILHIPRPGYEKKYVLAMMDYGSIDNDFSSSLAGGRRRMPAGVAHFLEHKLFEKEDGDLTDRFARAGASTNAMTSFESTGYYFECGGDPNPAFGLLLDLVLRPYFTEKLVEKEKGIIAQEIRMYEDDPSWRGSMAVLRNLFGRHPVATDIAGTVESIQRITAEDLALCHGTFYAPSNVTLVAVGDMDLESLAQLADDFVMQKLERRTVAAERHYATPRARVAAPTKEKLDVSTPKYFSGWRVPIRRRRGPALMDLETALDLYTGALFSRSGPLHKRLYESGLIDDSFSVSVTVEREFGFVSLSGDTPDPAALARAVLDGVREARRTGPSPAELRRIRRKMYGGFVRGFNSLETTGWNAAECYVKGVDYLRWGDRLAALPDIDVLAAGRAALAPASFSSHTILPRTGQ
jgi:predicted Zn-dependent peptidase